MIQLPNIKTEYKWALGFVFCALLLCFIVGSVVSLYKDRAFDKAIAEQKALRQKEIKRGDDAEARAIAAETDKLKYHLAFELAGKDIETSMRKVNDAETKFNEDMQSIDSPVSECERYLRLRAKLKLKPVTCE